MHDYLTIDQILDRAHFYICNNRMTLTRIWLNYAITRLKEQLVVS